MTTCTSSTSKIAALIVLALIAKAENDIVTEEARQIALAIGSRKQLRKHWHWQVSDLSTNQVTFRSQKRMVCRFLSALYAS